MSSNSSKTEIDNFPQIFNSFSSVTLSENENFISKLPPEILLHIFRFIPRRDLQRSVGLVNRYWHQLSRDPTLLRVLKLSKKAPVSIVYRYIEQRPLLTVLKASGLLTINESIEKIVTNCPFLICLDIGFCDLIPESILSICKYARNLKHINLEGVSIDHDSIDLICTYLPQLEILNLSHCVNLTDQSILSISELLTIVSKINIDGIQNITDYGLIYLCQRHLDSLSAIWIDGCELTEIGLAALTDCRSLSTLSISYADSLSDQIVYPIRSLESLRSLTIHKAVLLSKSALLEMFRENESRLTRLMILDLNECSVIDDEVLGAILGLCGRGLRALSLQWCWNITDAGIEQLVSVAVEMERLSLIGNHVIRGTGFGCLPEEWSKLRLLNLTNCNQIDDELMKRVAERMPMTFIFDYFGERFGDYGDSVTQYDVSRAMEKVPICDHL